MTREQYQKHKEAIQWFYEQPQGTKIWENKFGEWELTTVPLFDTVYDYAINDEYAEFRKAIVDGKQVESKVEYFTGGSSSDENRQWKLDTSGKFVHNPKYYRIKPDEPKFKIGDWVVPKIDILSNDYTYYMDIPMQYFISSTWKNEDTTKFFKQWGPRQGEWCWFWSDVKMPYLGQFKCMDDDFKHLYVVDLPNRHNVYTFEHCEPYIGTLPTIINNNRKENK